MNEVEKKRNWEEVEYIGEILDGIIKLLHLPGFTHFWCIYIDSSSFFFMPICLQPHAYMENLNHFIWHGTHLFIHFFPFILA